ncbi:3-oxoacyl-ACP reductase [Azorhizobium oxalatiphilum]|uniref:3-oxoacyl-ACP reductase n=1 Tax=Azorhizobium oxalatiphilum TaxID=980631 RepID=A0A917BYD2_9HYPH|nr:glucose 1-dehydrogenase [Azorhizobium oxalatiphilum]GGF62897.1 3-oxoacyl-ACP reductase [Azorhizobium oxalatiphilum]
MKLDLHGKRVLITGASSGLGAHFARLAAGCGAQVIAAARNQDVLTRLVAEITQAGHAAQSLSLDVTRKEAADDAIDRLGAVDVLINNAGITRARPALDQSEADWDDVVDTNLKGMFFVAQAVARKMIADKRPGAIVNVASILGLRQAGAVLPYAVSKAGVIQMTKSLALELARHNIRVNALAPGYVATELNKDFFDSEAGQNLIRRIPTRRLGELEDLDGPLLLLASDASRHMTGSTIVVDGGHLLSGL